MFENLVIKEQKKNAKVPDKSERIWSEKKLTYFQLKKIILKNK